MDRSAAVPARGVPRPRGVARSGLTLVETLVAASLAVVVLALALVSYRTLARILSSGGARTGADREAGALLAALDRDATGVFADGSSASAFLLAARGTTGRIEFCTRFLPPDETDARWTQPQRVRYEWAPGPDGRVRVSCARVPLGPAAGPAPVTGTVARALAAFAVEVLGGDAWQTEWPAQGRPGGLPAALRARLQTGPDHARRTWESETAIPAARTVPPPAASPPPGG